MTRLDRFADRVSPEPNSGCWLWTGVLDHNGYGRLGRDSAHRTGYLLSGRRIPKGMVLDHLCRIRCCVNPAHLEPVTQRENCRRGLVGRPSGDRMLAKTHCPSGHAYAGDNLYIEHKPNGRSARHCRICYIVRRKMDRDEARVEYLLRTGRMSA